MKAKIEWHHGMFAAVAFVFIVGVFARCSYGIPTNDVYLARSMGIEIPEIDAADLAAAFSDNSVRANDRYRNKLICVHAVVMKVAAVEDEGAILFLKNGVVVQVRKDQLELVAKLDPDDKIDLFGNCIGLIKSGQVGMQLSKIEPRFE